MQKFRFLTLFSEPILMNLIRELDETLKKVLCNFLAKTRTKAI